jgi:hypothetical protein
VSELIDVRSNMKPEFGERNVEEPYHHTLRTLTERPKMANKFNRIELHFDTPKGRHRAVLLKGTNVQALFLDGAESQFLPAVKAIHQPPPEESVSVVPDDLLDAEKRTSGPGVCYLINGELRCW